MWSKLYSTASGAPGSLNQRVELQKLDGARAPISAVVLGGIAMALMIGAGSHFNLRISPTDSAAAAGVYRVSATTLRRGRLVAACLALRAAREGLRRGYLQPGACPGNAEPVAKLIGALPGDLVEIEPAYVRVNGRIFANSASSQLDSGGRVLRHVRWGVRTVPAGEVWLFGFSDRRSWDSRYFGPVPIANVQGALEPVVTW